MRFVQSAKKNMQFFEKNLDFLDLSSIFVAEKQQIYLYNEKNTICINPHVWPIDTSAWVGGSTETQPYASPQLVEWHAES
jgi:hypothetical protein